MSQNQLFNRTQWRLTLWYSGVMAVILLFCGGITYQIIAHTYRLQMDRELKSLAGTVHDTLEPLLEKPGEFTPQAKQMFASFCLLKTDCPATLDSQRHIEGVFADSLYYVRFLDRSGQVVAVAGSLPSHLPETSPQQQWTTLQDTHGHSYRQISFHLHTQDYQAWGHFQVGRSLQDMERAIAKLQMALLLGLPLLILLVAVSGWGLSRLALRPIDQFCQHTQEFTADAAHELRTPVTAMRATLESLQSLATGEDPEMQTALAATIRQSCRLTGLVNDLLMLCRMEQQTLGVRKTEAFTWVSLRDLVEDTVEEFAGLVLQRQIHLYTQIPITEDLQVWGNTEHLYRLLGNLMGNAIHYTPDGGKVSLVLEKRGTEAWIQVQDTGVGISPEERAKIFERFYRGKCERPSGEGTGLGLAIAQAIVQAHGGRLSVTSQIGQGSIFLIRLPL